MNATIKHRSSMINDLSQRGGGGTSDNGYKFDYFSNYNCSLYNFTNTNHLLENVVLQYISLESKYCTISTLLMLISHSRTPHNAMLSNEHLACCRKHGIINKLIRVVSRQPGYTSLIQTVQKARVFSGIHQENFLRLWQFV